MNEIIAREALDNTKYITSIEIAELTGKMHKHVMEAIRKMEPAWESERGTNFRLSQIREKISNNGYKLRPCYLLTKTESLFIATKFNDIARARLVIRWENLETAQPKLQTPRQEPNLLVTEQEILRRGEIAKDLAPPLDKTNAISFISDEFFLQRYAKISNKANFLRKTLFMLLFNDRNR